MPAVTPLRPGFSLARPKPAVLLGWVTERLREQVISGALPRGMPLESRAMAAELGVSTAVIGRALEAVGAEGFAQRTGARWIVAPLQLEVRGLLRQRLACEPLLARQAARRLTSFGLHLLERMHRELVEAQHRQDLLAVQRANYRFHTALYDAAGQPELLRQAHMLWAAFPFDLMTTMPLRMAAVAEEHAAILRALRHGNPDAAAVAMREHIRQGWEEFRRHYPLDLAPRRRA